jgi:hypothetical protein
LRDGDGEHGRRGRAERAADGARATGRRPWVNGDRRNSASRAEICGALRSTVVVAERRIDDESLTWNDEGFRGNARIRRR